MKKVGAESPPASSSARSRRSLRTRNGVIERPFLLPWRLVALLRSDAPPSPPSCAARAAGAEESSPPTGVKRAEPPRASGQRRGRGVHRAR
jgi:hypothetical protein